MGAEMWKIQRVLQERLEAGLRALNPGAPESSIQESANAPIETTGRSDVMERRWPRILEDWE
jgi:hypothetical protein